jgi:hypothetical protein
MLDLDFTKINKGENETNRGQNLLSYTDFEKDIEKIQAKTESKLNEKIKNNQNYLTIKSNFQEDEELTDEKIALISEEELKNYIKKIDDELVYLNKKNKKPIDFILDRFRANDNILVKIIRIFELSMDEVINKEKTFYEDTVYFQFKVADKCKKI